MLLTRVKWSLVGGFLCVGILMLIPRTEAMAVLGVSALQEQVFWGARWMVWRGAGVLSAEESEVGSARQFGTVAERPHGQVSPPGTVWLSLVRDDDFQVVPNRLVGVPDHEDCNSAIDRFARSSVARDVRLRVHDGRGIALWIDGRLVNAEILADCAREPFDSSGLDEDRELWGGYYRGRMLKAGIAS